jgi:DNA replication protein DnaC
LIDNNEEKQLNNNETLEKMSQIQLSGIKNQYELIFTTQHSSKLTNDESLSILIESEYEDRINRRTKRIKKHESVIITGPTGSGKSFLASALGHQACQDGFKVLYYNLGKLFAKLRIMKADTSDIREKDRIEKHDLLILDDFGLEMLDTQDRITLLEIIEDRHGKRSTIITSQLPVAKWYDVIGDPTIADAILDRIVHTAHRIELIGESLRKKERAARESRN